MSISPRNQPHKPDRLNFIGGSDARVIMGKDDKALLRLWQEKRGEVASLDLSGVLIVQLGLVTEDLNRRWYEQNSGHRISDIQRERRAGWRPSRRSTWMTLPIAIATRTSRSLRV